MDRLQSIGRQFSDLKQKRQSTKLQNGSDEYAFESVAQQRTELAYPSANPRPIKKITNTLKNTFRRIENRDQSKKVVSEDDGSTLKNKTTVMEKLRNVKESTTGDLVKLYKQAKIIDVRNGKLTRTNNSNDYQNLLLFEELDNPNQH